MTVTIFAKLYCNLIGQYISGLSKYNAAGGILKM